MSGLSPVEPLLEAMKKYPPYYDELLVQVGARIRTLGEAGKRHLAALICWKQAGQGDWASELMEMPDLEVRNVTRHALVARTDQGRLDILAKLPGFAGDDAIATVVLAAHNPKEYSVLDERSLEGLKRLGRPRRCRSWAGSPVLRSCPRASR